MGNNRSKKSVADSHSSENVRGPKQVKFREINTSSTNSLFGKSFISLGSQHSVCSVSSVSRPWSRVSRKSKEITSRTMETELHRELIYAYRQIAQFAQKETELYKQLAQKETELYKQLAQKETELYKQLAQKETQLYKQLAQSEINLRDKEIEHENAYHALELKFQRLKNELANKNTDYLRITRSLHVRSVSESFERNTPILRNPRISRYSKWLEIISSPDPCAIEIRRAAETHGLALADVPNVVISLFKKISNDVHKDFSVSNDELVVVEKYFLPDELKLIKVIVECYPLSHVRYK